MPLTPTRVRKILPIKGRRTSWPADNIGDEYSPGNLNVRFRFGEVRNAPGREIFSGPETSEPASFIGLFPKVDGIIVWTIKLTTTQLRRLGATAPGNPEEWHNTPGTFTPAGTRRWNVAVGEDKFFFCRGDDLIAYWDGNVANPFQQIVALDGVVPRARYLEYFNNRLVAAYTTEGGINFANRIRWARNADFRRWDSVVGLGAGFLDVTDENQESIQGIRGLGERLVVYTRRSVREMIATGSLDPVHVMQTRARGIGCAAPYTLASNGVMHFFMAFDRNVWSWDGNQLTPVGEPIWEELKALTYPDQLGGYFGYCSVCRNEYWLVLYPSSDVFVYDYLRGTWSRDSIANLTALGEIERTVGSKIWTQLVGPWTAQNLQWQQLSGSSFISLIGGLASGATIAIDEAYLHDYFAIGSIMDRFVETPDYYLNDDPMESITLKRALIIYQYAGTATPYEFAVSVDKGVTWETHQVFPNRLGYSYIDLNITGNVVRFRFRENDAVGAFRWRSAEYEFLPGGMFLEPPPAIEESAGPIPPNVDVEFRVATAWNGFLRVTYGGVDHDFAIVSPTFDGTTVATLPIPQGSDVSVSMLDPGLAALCTTAGQAVTFSDGGAGVGWTFVSTAVCGSGYTFQNVYTLGASFPVTFVEADAPASASITIEARINLAWNGFLRITTDFGTTDFPVATPADDSTTLGTVQATLGTDVTATMLNVGLTPLCLDPGQSFDFGDGAFGGGWTLVIIQSLACGGGFINNATYNLTFDFPVAFVRANAFP